MRANPSLLILLIKLGCSKIESFLANLHPYYEQLCEFLEEEPDNHIIETEIEMIEHLSKNTDAKWLKEILGQTFKRNSS